MSLSPARFDYHSALDYLLGRINYERTSHIPYRSGDFKLDRMRALLERLGNPHERLPVVHITGTKGKGSTASMTAEILAQAGYRVGLYTSPHLERLEERFVFQGALISEDDLVGLVRQVAPQVEEMDRQLTPDALRGPTFFEITTAMAFLHFVQSQADIAVLEVGLGGRLDSTNVCRPRVCAITSISFDHTKQLGNTLAAIAREKAGIIKANVPIVCSVLNSEPREVIHGVAREIGAPLRQLGVDFEVEPLPPEKAWSPFRLNYRDDRREPKFQLDNVALGLRGVHQVANAATAIAIVRELRDQGWTITDDAIRKGLAATRCPARIEVVREKPVVVLDTAHNLASIQALCDEIQRQSKRERRVLVFATSRDKDAAGMLALLLPLFPQVVLTKYVNNPRARPVEELLEIAQSVETAVGAEHQIHCAEEPLAAWSLAGKLATDDSLICITGSFFLAAELRREAMRSL